MRPSSAGPHDEKADMLAGVGAGLGSARMALIAPTTTLFLATAEAVSESKPVPPLPSLPGAAVAPALGTSQNPPPRFVPPTGATEKKAAYWFVPRRFWNASFRSFPADQTESRSGWSKRTWSMLCDLVEYLPKAG